MAGLWLVIVGFIVMLAVLKYSAGWAYGKGSWSGAFIQWLGIVAIQLIILVLVFGMSALLA